MGPEEIAVSEKGRTMKQSSRGGESGFSLIELMVAMTITVVVSGAIYGLIAGGQTAFRREPELSDRQQNIRVAMDLILRDITNAGSGLPSFIQSFTTGLDACAGCPGGAGAPLGPDGEVTDELEMLTNTGARENEPACHTAGAGSSTQVRLMRQSGTIPDQTVVILIMDDGTWTVMNVTDTSLNNTGADNCENTDHTALNFNTGANDQSNLNRPGGVCQPNAQGLGNATSPCDVQEVSFAEVVRYRIRPDPDGVPVLERFTTADFAAGFQTIARGIENLQVQYVRADLDPTIAANWVDSAPVVVPATPGSLISQVRVTLAARSEADNVQGMTTAASARAALRGQLTATGSPRSTLLALSIQTPTPLWR
jgi:type IV pilus assembly protein PilW